MAEVTLGISVEDRLSPMLRILASLIGDRDIALPARPADLFELGMGGATGLTAIIRPSGDLCVWMGEVLLAIDAHGANTKADEAPAGAAMPADFVPQTVQFDRGPEEPSMDTMVIIRGWLPNRSSHTPESFMRCINGEAALRQDSRTRHL